MEGIQQTDVKKSRYESAKQPLVRYVKNPLVKYVKYQVVCSVLVLAFIALLIFAPIFSMDLGSLVGYDAYDVAAVQTLTKVQEAEEEALYNALKTAKDNGDISSTEYNEAISVIENGGLITALENGVTVINSGYNDNIKAYITSALNSAKANGDISSTEYNELISVLENGEFSSALNSVLVSYLESAIAESGIVLDSALENAYITNSFYSSISNILKSYEIGSVLVSSLESAVADSETALNSAIDDCYEALYSALVSDEITRSQYDSIYSALDDGEISSILENAEISSFLVSSLNSAIAESGIVLDSALESAKITETFYNSISDVLKSGKVGNALVSSLESALADSETALDNAIADFYEALYGYIDYFYEALDSALESGEITLSQYKSIYSALYDGEISSILENAEIINSFLDSLIGSTIADIESVLDSVLENAEITESVKNSISDVLESGKVGNALVSSINSAIAESEKALADFYEALYGNIDYFYAALASDLESDEITQSQYDSIRSALGDREISGILENAEIINNFLVSYLESAIADCYKTLDSALESGDITQSQYDIIHSALDDGEISSILENDEIINALELSSYSEIIGTLKSASAYSEIISTLDISTLESALAYSEIISTLKSALTYNDIIISSTLESVSAYNEIISTLESVSAYNEIISTLESVSAYGEIKSALESTLESSTFLTGMFAVSDGSSNSKISVGLVDDELMYTIVLGEEGGTISSVSVSVDTSDIVFSFSLFDELKLAFTSFGTMADATVSASVISFLIHIIALVLIGIAVVLAVFSLVKNLPRVCYSSSKYSIYNYTLNEYGEDVIAEIMYNPVSKKDKFKNAIRNPLCLILGAIVLEFIGLIINGVINSTLIEKVTDLCEMIASGEIVEAVKVLTSGETIVANATSYMSYMTGVNIWFAVVLFVAVLTLSVFIYCMSLKSNVKENILINSLDES